MYAFIFCAVLHAAEPSLTLEVNRDKIQQLDHVVLKAIVSNRGDELLRFVEEPYGERKYIRYQWKFRGEWLPIPISGGTNCDVPGVGPLLEKDAAYAEYQTLQLNKYRTGFLFEKPGTYSLRAVAATSAGRVESRPIAITVGARGRAAQQRIREHQDILSYLGASHLPHDTLPREFRDLRDAGGNIGSGVEIAFLLESVHSRQVPLVDDDVVKTLSKELDGIDLELGLQALGEHYEQQLDWKHLQQVVDALPHATSNVVSWERSLDFRRPAVFVPRKAKDEAKRSD